VPGPDRARGMAAWGSRSGDQAENNETLMFLSAADGHDFRDIVRNYCRSSCRITFRRWPGGQRSRDMALGGDTAAPRHPVHRPDTHRACDTAN